MESEGKLQPPSKYLNQRGWLTNGVYTVNPLDMKRHKTGSLRSGKCQFLFYVDAESAVLDAAAYADRYGLWNAQNKAKVCVVNGFVGVLATGELTRYINVYRTDTGFVHGCPGVPP
ncbi:MAG: hypothetical protein J7647_18170 [Cyanobacteria bacterium SBLK]|nr:hypothetical protein [Cyanobacteria bacterium SBLK]